MFIQRSGKLFLGAIFEGKCEQGFATTKGRRKITCVRSKFSCFF